MKKIIYTFTFLLLFSTLSSFCQMDDPTRGYESAYIYDWNGSSWVANGIFNSMAYDANCDKELVYSYNLLSNMGDTVINYLRQSTYDAQGNLFTESYFSDDNGVLKPTGTDTLFYNASNILYKRKSYNVDPFTLNFYYQFYSDYIFNVNSQLEKTTSFTYNTNFSSWDTSFISNRYYNAGQLMDSLHNVNYDSNVPDNAMAEHYTYNAFNKLDQAFRYSPDATLTTWSMFKKYSCLYNASQDLEDVNYYTYDPFSSAFQYDLNIHYNYNTASQATDQIASGVDVSSGNLLPYMKFIYTQYCTPVGLPENTVANNDIEIFPNPVTGGSFTVVCTALQNENYILQLFDVNGKLQYEQALNLQSSSETINLPELSSGIYNCVITNSRERLNKKITVFKKH